MEIKGEDYSIYHNDSKKSIEFFGSIRLKGSEYYQEIVDLMTNVHEQTEESLVLDFRKLEYLNSSGITAISKFVINSRNADKLSIKVLGSNEIYWQQKSLKNLQKLWPKIQIELV